MDKKGCKKRGRNKKKGIEKDRLQGIEGRRAKERGMGDNP